MSEFKIDQYVNSSFDLYSGTNPRIYLTEQKEYEQMNFDVSP
jgi:hypothetical protein